MRTHVAGSLAPAQHAAGVRASGAFGNAARELRQRRRAQIPRAVGEPRPAADGADAGLAVARQVRGLDSVAQTGG